MLWGECMEGTGRALHPGAGNMQGGHGSGGQWPLVGPVPGGGRCQRNRSRATSCPYPLCNRPHRLDAGPVEIVIELACLDELVVLNVLLHLFSGHHEVVVLAVHLILTPRPGSICRQEGNAGQPKDNGVPLCHLGAKATPLVK